MHASKDNPKANVWWAGPDLNRGPSACQADVLTKLDDRPENCFIVFVKDKLRFWRVHTLSASMLLSHIN